MTAITLHLQLREYDYPREEYSVHVVSNDIVEAVCLHVIMHVTDVTQSQFDHLDALANQLRKEQLWLRVFCLNEPVT